LVHDFFVHDLLARTYIGLRPEEQEKLQDVLIHFSLQTSPSKVLYKDSTHPSVDYKTLTKKILSYVQNNAFYLLEYLAEQIAALILDHQLEIMRTAVTLEKPGALRFSRTVGVTAERRRLVLLLGSNINPQKNLQDAAERLRQLGFELGRSAEYRTASIGPSGSPDGKPDFLNMAAAYSTDCDYQQIRSMIRSIEEEAGRVRTADRYAPRTIDIDIVSLGDSLFAGQRESERHSYVRKPVEGLYPDFFKRISWNKTILEQDDPGTRRSWNKTILE